MRNHLRRLGYKIHRKHLVAVMDWRLSNTLDSSFCVEALKDAIQRYGRPEIFNADQGTPFASEAVTSVLIENEIKISMDGRGRARDNIFIVGK